MKITCLHCGSDQTAKAGFTINGKQRYYCRHCRRFSREHPHVRTNSRPYRSRYTGELPSKGVLALQLQAIAQDLQHTPTTAEVAAFSKLKRCAPPKVFYAVFGDFNTALKSARLRLRYRREFDPAQLLKELKALHKSLGRPLIARDVAHAARQGRVTSPYYLQRVFGTVPNAIRAAGASQPKPTREELLGHLKRLHRELGHAPREGDVTAAYQAGLCPAVGTFEREFGGLGKARRAAGIRAGHWQRYTRQELLAQLQTLGQRLGCKPTDRDIRAASRRGEMACAETFIREFGSLIAAYRAAGFTARPRQYTEAEVVRQLQQLTRKLGRVPGWAEIKAASQAGECPSPNTIYLRYGTLAAMERKARLSALVHHQRRP